MSRIKVRGKIIESKINTKNITLVKIEIDINDKQFDDLQLKDYKKVYFSEFEDEPSWQIINKKIYIIDALSQFSPSDTVDSPPCKDPNIIFNWQTNKVMTIEEYQQWTNMRKDISN
jgi:hypothetical protein